MSKANIQFSWDDGAYDDLKLLKYIKKYKNLQHTFYVPAKNPERKVIGMEEIKELADYGLIGSHTYNHTFLNTIPLIDVKLEVLEGKKYLEDILGYEVNDFCYPGGKYNSLITKEIKQIVSSARTTNLMSCNVNGNFNKNTTLQLVYRERKSLIKHIVAFAPIKIKMQLLGKIANHNYKLLDLVKIYLDYFKKTHNESFSLHLWGHSWEIEESNMWQEVDEIFAYLDKY